MKKHRKKGPWPPARQKPPDRRPEATAALQALPTYAIVAAINSMIDVLRQRGQPVRDWDERDKVVYKFSVLGGKVYALAPRENTMEAATHDNEGGKPGG